LIVEAVGKIDSRLDRRDLVLGVLGDYDVAEGEDAARSQSRGDSGEKVGLVDRSKVMDGESRDDEIEVPGR
jgi:hypothetical protein